MTYEEFLENIRYDALRRLRRLREEAEEAHEGIDEIVGTETAVRVTAQLDLLLDSLRNVFRISEVLGMILEASGVADYRVHADVLCWMLKELDDESERHR